MRVRYAGPAVGDLQRLREFLATGDRDAAGRIVEDLIARISVLAEQPRLGRALTRDGQATLLREIVVGAYIVRYRPSPQEILVLRIWHHREYRN